MVNAGGESKTKATHSSFPKNPVDPNTTD